MNPPTSLPKQVIIIDDSRGPIDYYVEALKLSGYSVRHIATVREALSHIANERPADLYAVDIMMPVGDSDLDIKLTNYGMTTGLVLRDRIREKYKDKQIIILTNVSAPEILDALPQDAATTVLSKPDLLPFELVTFVERLL
jgi:CheY-like chemotaxis protein